MKFIIIYLLLLTSAWSQIDEKLHAVFSQSYRQDYRPLTCSDNVMALGNRLVDQGFDEEEMFVVFITHKHVPHVPLYPRHQRLSFNNKTYKPSPWTFHALLLFKNNVLDLDFTDQPTILPIDKYFDTMWDQENIPHMRIQIKPFTDYRKEDFGGTFAGDYPYFSINELLSL